MLYRKFGNTDKKISLVSFGGMRFPEPHKTDKMAEIPVKAAEKGINYFDTAPYYCDDQSQTIMAKAAKEIEKKGYNYYIGTKSNSESYDEVWRDLENSLKTLDMEKVNFYYCWCIIKQENFEKRVNQGALKALMEIKEQGLADHITVSSHQHGEEIEELVNSNYFEGILLGYHLLNFPFRQQGIRASYNKDMGIFIMNPLGGGVLTDPANEERLKNLKMNSDQSMLEASLHFLFLHKEITSALTGFSSKEEVETAVNAVETFEEKTKGVDLEEFKKNITESFPDLCTGCRYCEVCPQNIPVSKLIESYNYYLLYDDKKEVSDRLYWHWGISPDEAVNLIDTCTQCQQCEEECTQQLPIIERLNEIKSMVK